MMMMKIKTKNTIRSCSCCSIVNIIFITIIINNINIHFNLNLYVNTSLSIKTNVLEHGALKVGDPCLFPLEQALKLKVRLPTVQKHNLENDRVGVNRGWWSIVVL